MIKCFMDQHETKIEAEGRVETIAADACEVIRAIYWKLPGSQRNLFRMCVKLAVNHKDSPMWGSAPPAESLSIVSADRELKEQVEALRRNSGGSEGGQRRDEN